MGFPDSSNQDVITLKAAMNVIGGHWRLVIVHRLLNGPRRFSDLQKDMGIARRMLTVNLRALEEAGLVVRKAYAEVPPRVEYGLTPEGMELCPLIEKLCLWRKSLKGQPENPEVTRTTFLPVQ